MSKKPQDTMAIRIAFRHEGEFWNAYIAHENTMKDAFLIGSIAFGSVVRNPEAKQQFIDLMQVVFEDAARAMGLPIGDREIRPGPEHERAGHA